MSIQNLSTRRDLRASSPWLEPVVTFKDGPTKDDERVLYALQPKQLEAYRHTPVGGLRRLGEPGPTHIGYGGSAGSGKSFWARVVAMAVACMWPGSTSIIFRETEGDVKKNHVDPMLRELQPVQDLWSYNGKEMCLTWANKSQVYFGYLKKRDDLGRYQGPSYDAMIFEESTLYLWFLVEWLTGNRLRASVDGSIPFACYPSNPGGPGHTAFKRLFVDRRYRQGENPADYVFVQAFLKDNLELMRRDPGYARRLDLLPEPYRSWQRDGNFAAGAGSALATLDRRRHIIRPFEIPLHWVHFGAFDWGFAHPFSFGHYVVNEDGTVFCVDTVAGMRLLPAQQAERIQARVPIEKLSYIVAGHDVKAKIKARGEDTPTIQETFAEYGMLLDLANIDRIQGFKNLIQYLDWTVSGPIIEGQATEGDPRLRFFDTPTNQKVFDQLESMVEDPDEPEDVLKVDADAYGEGGDDHYDQVRYACASRPIKSRSTWKEQETDAWSPEILAHEADVSRRSKRPTATSRVIPDAVT